MFDRLTIRYMRENTKPANGDRAVLEVTGEASNAEVATQLTEIGRAISAEMATIRSFRNESPQKGLGVPPESTKGEDS